jgi:hypothetical protein
MPSHIFMSYTLTVQWAGDIYLNDEFPSYPTWTIVHNLSISIVSRFLEILIKIKCVLGVSFIYIPINQSIQPSLRLSIYDVLTHEIIFPPINVLIHAFYQQ